ncbi:claudin-16-like [Eleutherodactylus coqui]|uniref:claudin-16-like n=1 Tax=Eleutherodactylus coqui TaxID=57060 RepID=UPI00346246A8
MVGKSLQGYLGLDEEAKEVEILTVVRTVHTKYVRKLQNLQALYNHLMQEKLTARSLIWAQINSKGSVMLSTRCKGLWRECVWDRFVKIWTCDAFSSYLNPHPATIVLTRALLIISSIMSVFAFCFLILGFKNFIWCQDASTKLQCLRLTSGLYFLVGMSSSAGIIRYCIYVYHVHQYEVSLKIPGFPSFEYGYSLWMAVGGNLGAITTAAITCYLSLHKTKSTVKEGTTASGQSEGPHVLKTYV